MLKMVLIRSVMRIRICIKVKNTDKNQSQNSGTVEAQNGAMEGRVDAYNGGVDAQNDAVEGL
jgi:hypothetical protein